MHSIASPAARRQSAPRSFRSAPGASSLSRGLSAQQERSLAARIMQGDRAARDELVVGNLALARYYALRHVHHTTHDLDLEDLEQAGAEGLVVAANRFDPDTHGTRFSTYATYWIRQRIWLAVVNTGERVRIPSHIHTQRQAAIHRARVKQAVAVSAADGRAEDPLERLLEIEDRDRFRACVRQLTLAEQRLLHWYATDHGTPGRKLGSKKFRENRAIAAKRLLAQLGARLNPEEGSSNA